MVLSGASWGTAVELKHRPGGPDEEAEALRPLDGFPVAFVFKRLWFEMKHAAIPASNSMATMAHVGYRSSLTLSP